jgi:hypothetical protein
MSVSRKIDILERLGKTKEARDLLRDTVWYRCGDVYYKPSSKTILDGNKILIGEIDIKNCNKVPFGQIDALEAKIGITPMPGIIHSNHKPKGRCCR